MDLKGGPCGVLQDGFAVYLRSMIVQLSEIYHAVAALAIWDHYIGNS